MRFISYYKNVVLILASSLLCITLSVTILWIVVALGFFSDSSKMQALNYLSPFSLILIYIFPGFLFLLAGKFKLSLWTFGIYLLFFIGFGDFSFVTKDQPQSLAKSSGFDLSVAAINLRYFSYGFEQVVNGIKQLDADICLLSENVISEEQVKVFEEQLHPSKFYMGQQEGTAIISKYPVISFKEITLPTRNASLFDENDIEKQHENSFRSFSHAIIQIGQTPVHLISIRFIAGRAKDRSLKESLKWGFYLLKSQVSEVNFFLDYVKKLEGPVIFGGDLNATPSSFVIKKISKIARDAYLENHIWGGFTFWTEFPPYARLDYLFFMNGVQAVESKIIKMKISDHYPVWGQFRVLVN